MLGWLWGKINVLVFTDINEKYLEEFRINIIGATHYLT